MEQTAAPVPDNQDWMTALDGILWTEGSTTQQAAEILPWLFVGGKPAASDAVYANNQAFTHMLSTIEPWYADGPNADQITYNGFEADDEMNYPLLERHWPEARQALLAARDHPGGRALVHCAHGVNRSVCIVVAFLIEQEGMSLLEAVHLVKVRRGCVLGNLGFRRQLVEMATRLNQLGSIELKQKWIQQQALKPPPPKDWGVPPPPQEWRDAAAVPVVGARCRVQDCGKWYNGLVTKVLPSGMVAVMVEQEDPYLDHVQGGTPDIYMQPDTGNFE